MSKFSDLNYDSNVDISDILIAVNEILYSTNEDIHCYADANHDGNLDVFDLLLIIGNIINL